MDRGQYFPASSDDLGEIRHSLGQRLTWYEGRARNREIASDFVERRDGQLMLVRQTFSRGIGRSTLIAAIAMGVMFTVGLVLAGVTGGAVVASLGFLILPRFITRNAPPRFAYTRDCPHCTYDLEGCPPGIAVEDNYGLDIGPRACPECGCPWPLIPPRTPKAPAEP